MSNLFDPRRIAVFGACCDDGAYGLGTGMPWPNGALPGDLPRFRDITSDTNTKNWLICGMKTFETMQKVKFGQKRLLVGISRTQSGRGSQEGSLVLSSFEGALDLARISEVDKVFFIGGEAAWNYGFSVATIAYITRVRRTSDKEEVVRLPKVLDETARESGMTQVYSRVVEGVGVWSPFEFQTWEK